MPGVPALAAISSDIQFDLHTLLSRQNIELHTHHTITSDVQQIRYGSAPDE